MRVVAGAILHGGRVLAAQRGLHKSQGGLWELPGGKVEAGESDTAALVRELREELGITVRVGICLGRHRHAYGSRTIELVAYRCRVVGGEPLATEHEALRWLDGEALHTVTWAPADIPLLEAVRRALSE